MINLSQEVIIALIIKSFFCGVGIGCFYDNIRMLKMFFGVEYGKASSSPSKPQSVVRFVVTFVCDIVFWIVVAITSIILIYATSGGVFRGLTYICMSSGFLLYYFSIGQLVLKLNAFITKKIKRLVLSVAKLLIFPIRWLCCGIIHIYRLTIGRIIDKIVSGIKKKLEKRKELCTNSAQDEEKEAFVYVTREERYKREGRINFGYAARNRE